MYGGIELGDIVTHKDYPDRSFLVTGINNRNFNHAGNWAFYLTLTQIGSGGGLYDVASDNVSVIMTRRWYEANHKP